MAAPRRAGSLNLPVPSGLQRRTGRPCTRRPLCNRAELSFAGDGVVGSRYHLRGSSTEHENLVEKTISLMILPQVHLRKPCYDFCPVQATAIKAVSIDEVPAKAPSRRSLHFSKWLSSGQRRAVCTKGRDVISTS